MVYLTPNGMTWNIIKSGQPRAGGVPAGSAVNTRRWPLATLPFEATKGVVMQSCRCLGAAGRGTVRDHGLRRARWTAPRASPHGNWCVLELPELARYQCLPAAVVCFGSDASTPWRPLSCSTVAGGVVHTLPGANCAFFLRRGVAWRGAPQGRCRAACCTPQGGRVKLERSPAVLRFASLAPEAAAEPATVDFTADSDGISSRMRSSARSSGTVIWARLSTASQIDVVRRA